MGALQNYLAKLRDAKFRQKLQKQFDEEQLNYQEAVSEAEQQQRIQKELNHEINKFLQS